MKIPLSVFEAGWKAANCDVDLSDEERKAEDLGRALKLVEVYCWRAAYQTGSIFFAVDPKAPDEARLLRFPTWVGKGKRLDASHSLTSPDYDPKTRTLTMAHKGHRRHRRHRRMGVAGIGVRAAPVLEQAEVRRPAVRQREALASLSAAAVSLVSRASQ